MAAGLRTLSPARETDRPVARIAGNGYLRPMRIPSELWVKALIRRSSAAGVPATVVRHGDDRAGAIYVKVSRLDGTALLYGPAPASLDDDGATRRWSAHLDPEGAPERDCDAYLARQADFDEDLWIVEIEDRSGRSFIED